MSNSAMKNVMSNGTAKWAIGIVAVAALVLAGIVIGENTNIFGETEASMSDDSSWGYSGDTSPGNWGDLSDEYSQCALGREQSPIDIDTGSAVAATAGDTAGGSNTARETDALSFHYGSDEIHAIHTGLFVKIKYESDESHIRLGDRAYNLIEVHPHTPSEHTIDGRGFPMEMHLVHRGEGDELAVVGILYRVGEANPAVEHFIDSVPIHPGDDYFPSEHFNAAELLPDSKQSYSYMGSLTTPPCSEGVRWTVMSEIQEVSQAQVDRISALTNDIENNRPVQPLGERTVYARN